MARSNCSLCNDRGCPACGVTPSENPTIRAWEAAQDALEAAFIAPGLSYGSTHARVRVCGVVVAEVHGAPDAITAIEQVTRIALKEAA